MFLKVIWTNIKWYIVRKCLKNHSLAANTNVCFGCIFHHILWTLPMLLGRADHPVQLNNCYYCQQLTDCNFLGQDCKQCTVCHSTQTLPRHLYSKYRKVALYTWKYNFIYTYIKVQPHWSWLSQNSQIVNSIMSRSLILNFTPIAQ
jgi:hypothetical protein